MRPLLFFGYLVCCLHVFISSLKLKALSALQEYAS